MPLEKALRCYGFILVLEEHINLSSIAEEVRNSSIFNNDTTLLKLNGRFSTEKFRGLMNALKKDKFIEEIQFRSEKYTNKNLESIKSLLESNNNIKIITIEGKNYTRDQYISQYKRLIDVCELMDSFEEINIVEKKEYSKKVDISKPNRSKFRNCLNSNKFSR